MKNFIIPTIIAIIILGTLIFYYSGRGTSANDQSSITDDQPASIEQSANPTDNVKIEDGKQIIEITAWGGYSPRQTVAKANLPTVIRVKTNNTFDCSAALIIPNLKIQKYLPSLGTTDIAIPTQKANSSFRAFCAMGMYNFEIRFE